MANTPPPNPPISTADDLEKLLKYHLESRDISRDITAFTKDILKYTELNASTQIAILKTHRDISKSINEQSDNVSRVLDGDKKTKDILKDIAKNKLLLQRMDKEQMPLQEQLNKLIDERSSSGNFSETYRSLTIEIEQREKLIKAIEAQKAELKETNNLNEQAKKISEQADTAGKGFGWLSTFTSNIPGLRGLSESFTKAEGAARAHNLANNGKGGMGAGLKSLSGSLGSFMKGPIWIAALVAAIKFIVDAMFGASKLVAQFRRDFGVSAKSVEEIRQRTYDIAQNSENLADTQGLIVINQAQIVKSLEQANLALGVQMDLTSALGGAGEKLLAQNAILRDNLSLEEEAIAGLTQEFIRSGEEVENITKSSLGNVALIGKQKGLNLDNNKLLAIAAKTAGSLRSSFKDNTAEIAKGVAQLQLMGLTLEDTKKISSGLLDFETSISNQISAELLTGKQFNLERARLLALNRDYVGVGKEIIKQGITSNYLNGLNEIQLGDQAKLFNLNSDELTDIVRKQESYNALSVRALKNGRQIYDVEHKGLTEIYQDLKKQGAAEEEIAKILGDELYSKKQSEDAQTKFNKALEQAKGAFERLVSSGALDELVEGITKFVNLLGGGQASSNKAYELEQQQKISQQSGDKARVQELSKLITEQKQEAEDAAKTKGAIEGGAKGLATAIGLLALGTVLDLTGVGAVVGLPMQAAGLAAISATLVASTAIGAGQGYLKASTPNPDTKTINAKDFTIKTLPEDTIVAAGGTKLGNSDKLLAATQETNSYLRQLLAKETNLYVDYNKFATAGGKSTYLMDS